MSFSSPYVSAADASHALCKCAASADGKSIHIDEFDEARENKHLDFPKDLINYVYFLSPTSYKALELFLKYIYIYIYIFKLHFPLGKGTMILRISACMHANICVTEFRWRCILGLMRIINGLPEL